jgi:hypothetical protein
MAHPAEGRLMTLTMRKRMLSAFLLALTALALTGLAAARPAAASTDHGSRGTRPSHEPAVLTGVTASHHHGYDQLVFQFANSVPAHRRAGYVSRLVTVPRTLDTGLVGSAAMQVTFSPATGTGPGGQPAYGPLRQAFSLPDVIDVVTAVDQQGTVSFGIGLAARESFRMVVLPRARQVVVEVRTPYRTSLAHVFFVNTDAVFGTSAIQAVQRVVPAPATPRAMLQRLFAGPTKQEEDGALRFISSGVSGFRLSLSRGVASVYLVGGCNSAGSTVSVASEIVPTLRQFGDVRTVKIFDPSGRTQNAAGPGDSIPTCLQPAEDKVVADQVRGPVILGLLALAALGVLIGLIVSGLSVIAGLGRKSSPVTPASYVAERVKLHPVPTGQFEPDSAWPIYPLRQLRADLSRVEAERQARNARLWHWPFPRALWFIFFPVSLAAVACLAVAGLTTLVLAGLFTFVAWICAGLVLLAFGPAVAVARGAESAWHRAARTEASCPHCYHVTARPAYRCPRCDRLHRDIRPGRLGLVGRRCECGALLPTMVLRAAWRLQAVCQRCEEPLRPGSAAMRDVRIPIFGDTSAGKTRFMLAALDSLMASTRRAGMPLTFPDRDSEQQAELALELIRSGQDTIKTSLTLPTALSFRIGRRAGSSLVHLFDAAGEYYHAAEMHDSLGFLEEGHGLVYVLDPFSIGAVRNQVAGQNAADLALTRAATGDPETAYGEVVSRLRDNGVAAGTQRLAVVVSKADLLARYGLEPPDESAPIADWLTEAGVHNLVLSARREFAEVRYFVVASLAAGQCREDREPGAPLRWLLAAQGARLPGDPGVSPRVPRGRPPADADLVGADHGESAKAQP